MQTSITAIDFTGAEGAELAPVIRNLLAQVQAPQGERPIAIVCDIRDDATARLRREGYIAAVQIPPQHIETGHLHLEVITGHLINVHMRGDAPPFRAELAARAEQLKALNPFNQFEAEQILLLASDIPGVDVRLTLAPARTKPGELIGELSVYYQPFRILANVNNFGSRALGRYTAYARGEIYGLTGAADMTYIAGSTTSDLHEQQVVQLGHVFGMANNGVTIGGHFSYAWSHPDLHAIDPNDILNLRSRSLIGRFEATMPVARSRRASMDLRGGTRAAPAAHQFQLWTVDRRQAAGRVPARRIRISRAAAPWRRRVFAERGGGAAQGARHPRGIPPVQPACFPLRRRPRGVRRARRARRRCPAAVDFQSRGQGRGPMGQSPAARLRRIFGGQLHDRPRLRSGSRHRGSRDRDPAGIRADVLQKPKTRLQLFGFYDNAWVWNLDRFSTDHGRSVASWGGGARAVIAPYFLVEATYAKPVDRPFINGPKPPARLLLSLTSVFSPMR